MTQQIVRQQQTSFYVGDVTREGQVNAEAFVLNTTDPTLNVIGRAFTNIAGSDTTVEAGGVGVFAGILANKNEYTSFGTNAPNDPLGPSFTLNNGMVGDFITAAYLAVSLGVNATNPTGAFDIGDQIVFEQATGIVSALAPTLPPPAGTTVIPNGIVKGFNVGGSGLAEIHLIGGQIQS